MTTKKLKLTADEIAPRKGVWRMRREWMKKIFRSRYPHDALPVPLYRIKLKMESGHSFYGHGRRNRIEKIPVQREMCA
jgi:hypothetical protein